MSGYRVVPTFAISSLFLKAPSVRMASPFSSTSVHLSTGSSAALALLAVMEVVKMEVSKSSVVVRLRKSGFTVFGPHSLCCHDVLLPSSSPESLVDADLLDTTELFAARR